MKGVAVSLNVLFDGVTKGSKELYNGLPALSLDGQALATAITVHLVRPACTPTAKGTPPWTLHCSRPGHGLCHRYAERCVR